MAELTISKRGFLNSCVYTVLLIILNAESSQQTDRVISYHSFHDYLSNFPIELLNSENETNSEYGPHTIAFASSPADVLQYFRDMPRRHWSCCMLGVLAGDKGFHCNVNFYKAESQQRNTNRAHTRRMLFNGPRPLRDWGAHLMVTFERCIWHHAKTFHSCCYAQTKERFDIARWRAYRARNQRQREPTKQ